MQSDTTPSKSAFITPTASTSKTPHQSSDMMSRSSPQSSPRISTLRRAGADLFSGSAFSSANPFDADEFEFESAETSTTATDALPSTPGNELFSGVLYSSSNPFEADDDEFGDVSSTQSVRPRALESVYAAPSSETTSSAQATRGTRTLPPTPLRNQAGDEVEDQKSFGSPPTAIQPNTPTPSPQMSTMPRAGAGVFIQGYYVSSSPVDADEQEVADQFSGMQLSPTQTRRGNPLKSIRRRPIGPPTFVRGLPFVDSGREESIPRFNPLETICLSPTKEHKPAWLARAWRETRSGRSHERSVLEASTRSQLHKTSRITREEYSDVNAKSMWDADEDEFDRWPGQET